MVFESLINPVKAEKKPWEMFFIGIIYTSIAIILSLFIFRKDASLVMIFLTVLASVPLMYGAIKMEEKKDIEVKEQRFLIKEHSKALAFFMFLFFGFVVSFALWYVFLPDNLTENLFQKQMMDINQIENLTTGNAINMFSTISKIFFNNLLVMLFSLLFAFFYGAGAIFILTWNASVIGAAVGNLVSNSIGKSYFTILPYSLLRYSIHGIPEMLAYFMAGLAGSIISIAIIRHDFGSGKFKHILKDSLDLIFLAVIVLFIAALLEVFVTPLFF
jgi:uncharacterized membrane protein SpoIIM required for sporulation